MRQSPFGELIGGYHFYPQLRCFAACSGFHDIGPAPRNPQLILNLFAFVGAWLRRDAIASYVCYGSLWLSSNKSQFAFVVLSPLRYENLFFMSSCQKYTFFMSSCQKYLFFMSSCQKYTSSCPPCKYRTKSKKLLQNKNQFWRIKKLFLWCFAVQTASTPYHSATFTVQ